MSKRCVVKTLALFAHTVVTAMLAVTIVHLTAKAQIGPLCPASPDPAACSETPGCYSIDANGEGGWQGLVDILYLLEWQFLGGPAPQVCLAGDVFTPEEVADVRQFLDEELPEVREVLEVIDADIDSGLVGSHVPVPRLNVRGNLWVRNRLANNDTETTDGYGNIIVGYNEGGSGTGSHNIIVGKGNTYSSFASIIAANGQTLTNTDNYICCHSRGFVPATDPVPWVTSTSSSQTEPHKLNVTTAGSGGIVPSGVKAVAVHVEVRALSSGDFDAATLFVEVHPTDEFFYRWLCVPSCGGGGGGALVIAVAQSTADLLSSIGFFVGGPVTSVTPNSTSSQELSVTMKLVGYVP